MFGGAKRDVIRRALYGRRSGRKLSAYQTSLIKTVLPNLRIAPHEKTPLKAFPFPVDRLVLEIGFGSGENILACAESETRSGFIGCEPYINGVAKLVTAIVKSDIHNIRIYDGDARDLIEQLPLHCLDHIYLLFPDPWLKNRHHKRRFLNPENLAHFFRLLKPQAGLMIASDSSDYVTWILHHIRQDGGFEWCAHRAIDWQYSPANWVITRYETKALQAKRASNYLRFRRRVNRCPYML